MNRSQEAKLVNTTGRNTCLAKTYATDFPEHSGPNAGTHVDSRVPGMEAVIVTISGYDSATRTKLVKMIVHIGALNTGSLSNCNTHVVCWKFEGRKYELAKKLRKKFISHLWFEDCLKAGVLVPEEPYINKSGQEEAPLCWDDSVVDLPHGRALWKKDSTINLTESVSHPESSCGLDAIASTREYGPSAYNSRSSNVDHSDTGWSLPISSKGAVSTRSHSTRAGTDQAGSSCAAQLHLPRKPDHCSPKTLKLSDDGSQPLAEPHANHVPVELRTGKALDVSYYTWASYVDQSEGRRHQSGRAYCSRSYPADVGQQTRESCFPHAEHYGSGGRQDSKADYTQIRSRRRKKVEVPSGGLSEKYRRLLNESTALPFGELAHGDERAGSPGTVLSAKYMESLNSEHSERRTASVGGGVDNQRDSCVLGNTENACVLVEDVVVSASPGKDIACVICHTETKPTTEGLLECGHRYCYACIQKWADEAISKQSTCPLCKASFEFITIRELQRSANEEICTQVLEERVVLVGKKIRQGQKINLLCPTTDGMCIRCESRDCPGLLMTCSICCQRSCHTFCLDPPLPPGSSWLCTRCSPMRPRSLSRENVMSRFFT